ncbi:amidohydrolase family protein [Streptomyces sp. NBC_01276]|uniref:amidohydrolase family protein n=1 Tax=Streptomyces sp. NBC_01276 TaxID=2903808 RepID=UPI00352C568C
MAGVNLVFGSDLLGPLHSAQLEEFTLRAEVQPAADVIRSATSTAARLLRMEGEIGTLAPGAHADLLVVDGAPWRTSPSSPVPSATFGTWSKPVPSSEKPVVATGGR